MTIVVKLGSSIVADSQGLLREDVLDSVCGQVAELHHAGEDVAMVTSGAIALGMRLMELPSRPRTIDELQAASAVGQGTLFRAYESRLSDRDVHAAQVLLTSFDLSVRMHYLNARRSLHKLLQWRCVPVVNENDTTATDEITFGDNDFLSAQVALLLGARLLVLLTDIPGLHTSDPNRDPGAELVAAVDDFAELEAFEIGDRTSPFGSGGMRSKVAAAGMASAAGIPAVICSGTEPGTLRAAAAGEQAGHASPPILNGHRRSSSGFATPSRSAARSQSTPAPPSPARPRIEPAAGRHRRRGRRIRCGRRRRRGLRWNAGRQGDRQLLRRRAQPDQGHELGRGARAVPVGLRGSRPSRSIRACMSVVAGTTGRRWGASAAGIVAAALVLAAAAGADAAPLARADAGDGARATGRRSGWRRRVRSN